MAAGEVRARAVRPGDPAGRLLLDVPWELAERLREHFRARGVASALHLDVQTHQARLEPWGEVGDARLREILDEARR